jgi:ribosomal-protein-alanine N-acetyltransferase
VSEPAAHGAWRVTTAGAADLERVVAIAAGSFAAPWSRRQFEAELAAPDATLWRVGAAGTAGPAVGYLAARRVLDELHVFSLAVDPVWRRRGAGAALLRAVLVFEMRRGARVAHLEARADGPLGFYAAAGFAVVGRRPRYYEDGSAALLLSRALGPAAETPAPGAP